MDRKERIVDKFLSAVSLQEEPIPGVPLVEVAGTGRVLIENHKGITQYTTQCIWVKVKFGGICVRGSGLQIATMSKEQLVIRGNVEAVELNRGCCG